MESKVFSSTECSVVFVEEENFDKQAYADTPWGGEVQNGNTSKETPKDGAGASTSGDSSTCQSLLDHNMCRRERPTEPLRWLVTEKPFPCEQCPMAFDSNAQRKRHVLRVHAPEAVHECQVCHKKFRCFYSLQKHIPSHTGDMSFECDLCGKRFPFNTEVERHKRTHTGEKPYQCPMCPKSFTNSGNLTVHIRTHTGEKPFQCLVCGKSFSTSVKLRRHFSSRCGK